MSRFSQTSSVEYVGDSKDPDIVYYNASIVNNTTDDTNIQDVAINDPPIKFNETRDTALIRDASQYQFSIVRFVVNGGNKDLPLFIPAIQSGTGQTDVNLTEYAVAITYSGTDYGGVVGPGGLQYIEYVPETRNTTLAPLPRSLASPLYVGVYDPTVTYNIGDIVYYAPTPTTAKYYSANAYIYPQTTGPRIPVNPPPNVGNTPNTSPLYWTPTSPELGSPQDLSSRYYWVYTYTHWMDCVQTALEAANLDCYNGWVAAGGTTPYTSYNTSGDATSWVASNPTPIISFNQSSGLFSILYPPSYLSIADQTAYGYTGVATKPVLKLYFNTNMEGLFANFDNLYYNEATPLWYPAPIDPLLGPGTPINRWAYPSPTRFPLGYANEMVVKIINGGTNIVHKTTLASTPPATGGSVLITQDYASTSTLWSPIDGIVFTSSLLPIQNEQTAPPNTLGTKNTGNSAATSQSAFLPIITDVSSDLSSDPAGYRKMIYYAPTAEYRMADFQNSKADIRNIDVSVFWRNRLDNNLYPLSMFNLSSVSIKLMFRKKFVLGKSERNGQF